MARKGTAELQKAKEAKQKKIAIVGFVLLLAIMAFQGPRMWKMLKGPEAAPPPPPPATTTASTPTNGSLALPPVTAGTAAPTAAAPDSSTSDLGPAPDAGQLISFTRFASKDPFVQQIDPGAVEAPSGGSGSSGSSGGGKASSSGGKSGGGSTSGSSSAGGGSKPEGPTKATLVVNGAREEVAVGGEFPKDGPFFTLVAVGPSSARIGIAGGSYASGEQAATVRKGRTLVLQNTADGTRYEIELLGTS